MCVYVPVSPCSEGWSGLLWLQLQQPSSLAASSSNPLGRKQQQGVIIPQDQGRLQMLPGWAPCGESAPLGSDGHRDGGPRGAKPWGLIPCIPN